MEKRKLITIISGGVVLIGAGYLTYTSIRNKKERDQIYKILDTGRTEVSQEVVIINKTQFE